MSYFKQSLKIYILTSISDDYYVDSIHAKYIFDKEPEALAFKNE